MKKVIAAVARGALAGEPVPLGTLFLFALADASAVIKLHDGKNPWIAGSAIVCLTIGIFGGSTQHVATRLRQRRQEIHQR